MACLAPPRLCPGFSAPSEPRPQVGSAVRSRPSPAAAPASHPYQPPSRDRLRSHLASSLESCFAWLGTVAINAPGRSLG
ncbi:unnamed protein product [Rangifer tarandus platyrhynchus]|uniref:Uncharacterized protein n=2 Tax=Rangifer tarandus platyrhynchus TaxID=3082113 RepID=A0ABN8YYA8_RANTA|nr:unnamed protein product [Rangifer tarandus platyrhynchus]CAI9702292.1 unnamed protein product [Rangifer tarandus platyrhynchus]